MDRAPWIVEVLFRDLTETVEAQHFEVLIFKEMGTYSQDSLDTLSSGILSLDGTDRLTTPMEEKKAHSPQRASASDFELPKTDNKKRRTVQEGE